MQPDKPYAITLDPATSLINKTGSWRTERPVYVSRLPPCNQACPAGENIQAWLTLAEEERYDEYQAALCCWGIRHFFEFSFLVLHKNLL